MPRFLVHLAGGERVPVDAADPEAARRSALKGHPGAAVTKVKLDRTLHAPGRHGRLRGRLSPR